MKLKYIGGSLKNGGFRLTDKAIFRKLGDVLDVDITEAEINPIVFNGAIPLLEIIREVPVVTKPMKKAKAKKKIK